MSDKRLNNFGFTLVEMIVVTGIISLISVGIAIYVYQGFKLWNVTQDQITAQNNARAALKDIVGEIREMILSDNGSYPIEQANDFSIVFYANVDNDVKREKVKYELIDDVLYRWIVESNDDQPPQYPAFTQDDRTEVARNIINTDYLFRYYDVSYNGETDPLSDPFDLNQISLVQIKFELDYDPERIPVPLEIETNVSLRNLKYKYES